jgi:hypothetical protein
MKQLTAYEAFIRLNSLYVRFLTKPRKRGRIIQEIEEMTRIICEDDKVLPGLKQRAKNMLKYYQNMMENV